MSKPFEIEYSPSKWGATYGGINAQSPPNHIDGRFSPFLDNFILRNAELRSRPRFVQLLPGPDGVNPILDIQSFLSTNLVWHTVAFTTNGAFQLVPNSPQVVANGMNPWVSIGGPALAPSIPVCSVPFANVIYYTNGNGHLSAWDGAASVPITDVAFSGLSVAANGSGVNLPPSGSTTYGAIYLAELDSHLLLAYTTELNSTTGVTTPFPQRVRWSNSGFGPYGIAIGGSVQTFGGNLGTGGATFDPTVSVNSGFADFIEVPDIITGILTLGRVAYIFRQNGITEVDPTGVGTAPFDFNHLWASEQGIGSTYPFTIAQYGSFGIFVSNINVHQVSAASFAEIGFGARDAIFADLANAAGSPRGVIAPGYNLGYVYLTYNLFIPLPGNQMRIWVYSLEDKNWSRFTVSNARMLATAHPCWI